MSNSNENMERLPIKVVFTSQDDLIVPESSGGKRKIFDEDKLTSELRDAFVAQVHGISEAFSEVLSPSLNLPAVARVSLKKTLSLKAIVQQNYFLRKPVQLSAAKILDLC